MKNIIAKIPLVGQTNPGLSVDQHPLRLAIRKALRDTTCTRIIPLVALSLAGLTNPVLGQQATVEHSSLDGSNGFSLKSLVENRNPFGYSVSGAGDVNGDGIDDLLFGNYGADPNGRNSGASYVVFGTHGVGTGGTIELSSLDGNNGFAINGVAAADRSGISVSAAGDVNGDGVDDLLIGARGANSNGENSGASYVVFGARGVGANGTVELSKLNGSNGFVLNGVATGDFSGRSVSAAGDVNGDGIDDILISAFNADPNGDDSGASYVVFGASEVGSNGTLELSTLDGSNGFVLNGVAERDFSGGSVSSAGDVNGDGVNDLLIGASGADPNGDNSGASYVVFGASDVGSGDTVELSALNGTNGFVLNGVAADDRSGTPVSTAGDINGDGIDDMLIGAAGSRYDPINSYVVFGASVVGSSGNVELSSLNGSNGFILSSNDIGPDNFDDESNLGHSLSAAGDINGDGIDDLLVGPHSVNFNGYSDSDDVFVVFGDNGVGSSGLLELSTLVDGGNGFVIKDVPVGLYSFISVSAAGDVNDDGIDDILIGGLSTSGIDDPLTGDSSYFGNSNISSVVFGQVAGDPIDDPVLTTLDIQVSASSDDAEENTATGKVNRGSSDLELVNQGRHHQIVGMRFNGLNIPKGATITKASVQFQVDEAHSGNATLMIQGQATDNAPTFTNANRNISFRDRTNAVVDWSPVPWTTVGEAGADQQTPDIALVIQEIVNRQGWTSGNALAIIITGSGQHTAESFNGDAAGAPVLHVEYTTDPGVNQAPIVNAGTDQTINLPSDTNHVDVNLNGTVTDNGIPNPPGAVTTLWSKISGPGTVTFDDDNAVDTAANFDAEGTYVLRLTADDGDLNTFDNLTVIVNAAGSAIIQEGRVSASGDDAEEYTDSGAVNIDSRDLEMAESNAKNRLVGMRFNDINIPKDATITQAYLQFQANDSNSKIAHLKITGEARDFALTFTVARRNISSRIKTAAEVEWEPEPWNTPGEAGPDQKSPNIAAVIQEIVSQSGWSSGNSLAIIISGDGVRSAESFNGNPAAAPVLHVKYQ